jgi:Tfp pilus assembly protein PilF
MLSEALAAAPDSVDLHQARAEILARSHRIDLAEADYAWQRTRADKQGWMLNELCWSEAGFDPLLPAALADCEAALTALPMTGQIIDSHAFVLLRLGRLGEAQAEYDKALALRPHQAASLYGRGLVELRRGLSKQGQADIAFAQRLDAHVGEDLSEKGARP